MKTTSDETPGDVLTLHFEGPLLVGRSMPIYGLGASFIAVQRMVHKAALFERGELEKGAHLPMADREELALQISRHSQGSDIWALEPLLTNASFGPILQTLVSAVLIAVGAYIRKKVIPEKKPPANQTLIVNIFPEMRALTDRIDPRRGIQQITLIPQNVVEPLVLTSQTKEYVRHIQGTLVPGPRCELVGRVTRLHPQSFRFDLEDTPKHYIHVRTADDLFEKLRKLPRLKGRQIKIRGVPLYRLGNTADIEEFRADKLILLRGKHEAKE